MTQCRYFSSLVWMCGWGRRNVATETVLFFISGCSCCRAAAWGLSCVWSSCPGDRLTSGDTSLTTSTQVDTEGMKDIRCCWQIVTFVVCCKQDSHHFLLMAERSDQSWDENDEELFLELLPFWREGREDKANYNSNNNKKLEKLFPVTVDAYCWMVCAESCWN